jgi:uncharacterized protein
MDLTARTALVTGASRGIGRAVIEELARRPLKLVLAGVRDLETFEPVVPPPGGATEVRPVHIDLSSREAIDASADALGDQLADVDVLVNNAGQFTAGLLEEQDMADLYALMQVNLVAVAHLTQRVLPAMLRRGSGLIVNNTSIVGYAHMPAATTYAASKAGVVGLSESLRRELNGTGVGVLHVVTPGVETDMLARTDDLYGRYADTSRWDRIEPSEWARRVVRAIERDDRILGPGGRTALAKLASRGPAQLVDALSDRMFSRRPRR